MPRDESIVESAKQRSLRVPLDHFKRSDALVRTKFLVSAIAAATAIVYVGWLLFGGRAATRQASPAPVAAVHAAWNDDCEACHRDFQPLRGDAVSFAALFAGRSANRKALDQACIKCHDEPAHHAAAKSDEVPSCAACHHEHQGSAADIVHPSDATCVNCHRDIEHHRNGPSGLSQSVANVWGFGFGVTVKNAQGPHPEFRSLGSDSGNIKFNHWLHMQPGIAATNAKRKLKLSDLADRDRPKYLPYAKSGDLVELMCAACHEPQPSGGAYMQPIAYEQHCRACHPLQLKAAEGEPPAEVPHGLTAERLTSFVNGLLFAAEQNRNDLPPATADETGATPLGLAWAAGPRFRRSEG